MFRLFCSAFSILVAAFSSMVSALVLKSWVICLRRFCVRAYFSCFYYTLKLKFARPSFTFLAFSLSYLVCLVINSFWCLKLFSMFLSLFWIISFHRVRFSSYLLNIIWSVLPPLPAWNLCLSIEKPVPYGSVLNLPFFYAVFTLCGVEYIWLLLLLWLSCYS